MDSLVDFTSFWLGQLWDAFRTMPAFLGNNWTGAIFTYIFAASKLWKVRSLENFAGCRSFVGKVRIARDFVMSEPKNTLKLWAWIFLAFLAGHTLDIVRLNVAKLTVTNRDLVVQIAKPTGLKLRLESFGTVFLKGDISPPPGIPRKNGVAAVYIAASISNTGPPSTASKWSISMTSASGKTIRGFIIYASDKYPSKFGSVALTGAERVRRVPRH